MSKEISSQDMDMIEGNFDIVATDGGWALFPKAWKNKVFGLIGVVYGKNGDVLSYIFKDGETHLEVNPALLDKNLGAFVVSATINYGVDAAREEYGPMMQNESSRDCIAQHLENEITRASASKEIIQVIKSRGDHVGSGDRIVRFFEKIAGKLGDGIHTAIESDTNKISTVLGVGIFPVIAMVISAVSGVGSPESLAVSAMQAAGCFTAFSLLGGKHLTLIMASCLRRASLNSEFKPKMRQAILADCLNFKDTDQDSKGTNQGGAVLQQFETSPGEQEFFQNSSGLKITTQGGILFDIANNIFEELIEASNSEEARQRINLVRERTWRRA